VIFDEIESISWRRRGFERKAMLEELLQRAGPLYKEHFVRREKLLQQPQDRKISTISPTSMWFDKLFYFRLALAVVTCIACFRNGTIVVCVGSGRDLASCYTTA
jgi:hypothetical protein